MKYHSFTFASCLLSLLLTGCPSLPITSDFVETEFVSDLEIVHSIDLFEANIHFLSFSENGKTFVIGGKYDGVALLHADDYTILERYDERDQSGKPTTGIISTGYFDANTWYFTTIPYLPSSGQSVTHVRTIQPSQEFAAYSFPWRNGDRLIANKNIFVITLDDIGLILKGSPLRGEGILLVDWRNGAQHFLSIPPHLFESGYMRLVRYGNPITLTDSNRILAQDFVRNKYRWFLFDPFTQEKQELENGITFSPDERYAVDLNGFRCKLLKFRGKNIEPLKKQEVVGYCSGLMPDDWKEVIFSPDSKMFAVTLGKSVRVYRVEPFQLLFERTLPASVATVVLSDTGWLATADRKGGLRAWNVTTTHLARQYRLFKATEEDRNFSILLAIQPGGNKLITNYKGLTVFKLPEHKN